MSHMGVGKVLSGNKCPMVISAYPEDPELEGVAKRPMAEIQHSEEEDTTSVFTHCTSVEPVANPWESTMRVCLNVRLQIL
jgi:hypothetical protein